MWPRPGSGPVSITEPISWLSLAILTKGPIGLVLPGLIILAYLLGNRDSHTLFHMKLCRGLLLSLSIAALWYGPMVQLHGSAFLEGFIGVHNILRATVSEHPRNNTWWYYFLIFLIGCFPWSLSLPWLWKKIRENPQDPFPLPHLLAESG